MKILTLIQTLCCIGLLAIAAPDLHAQSSGKSTQRAFAIVVDQATYDYAEQDILSYQKLLEQRGMRVYTLAEQWQSPDAVKAALLDLYQKNVGLEGTVLIGDIPIPMIRDAQHLTSTFKMPQTIDWKQSSVPSDRFYDDFDLKFDFIKQDSTVASYFYYSLRADSPQRIEMDIYSARIKPPKTGSQADFHKTISAYLQKIVRQGIQGSRLDQGVIYSGHGYHSESMTSRAGEQLALKDQIPDMFLPGGSLRAYDFRMGGSMKLPLLQELQRKDLDLALLHSHGSDDAQLLNGYPLTSNPQPSIENVKRYLRSKIQWAAESGKDVEEAITRYQAYLDVPRSWMADALVDSVKIADSLFNASMDIYMSDLDQAKPNAKLVILDACDNGSFHLDDYIAGHYSFGEGKTVVTLASSIGILQDIWPTRMMGLLSLGVSPGRWLQETAYLETHLFGDPTFSFASKEDIADRLAAEDWESLKQVNNPDLQGLLIAKRASKEGASVSAELLNLVQNDLAETVRLEALVQLRKLGGEEYFKALHAALTDPYELTRRQALYMIEEIGADEFIPDLVALAFRDLQAERIQYKIQGVLEKMNSSLVLTEIWNYLSQHPGSYQEEIAAELTTKQSYTQTKLARDYARMAEADFDVKAKKFSLRTLRAYRYHQSLDAVLAVVTNPSEELELRLIGIEALSWFNESFQKEKVIEGLRPLLKDPTPQVQKETERSLAILSE